MQPEFSVVIPTFRRPQQLKQALNSVIAQGDIPLEIVVVDDSPESSAREVVDALQDSRVLYIHNEPVSGGVPSIVRNIGLKKCRGKFIHFLDDDDLVPDGYYKLVRGEFKENSRAGMVFGRIEPFGDCPPEQLASEKAFFAESFRRARICSRLGSVWPFVGQMLFGQVLLVCSAAIIKHECLSKAGGFDAQIVLHEDRDLYVRLMREYGAQFIDSVSLHYRVGFPSLMHAVNPSPEQLRLEQQGNRMMKQKYLRQYGYSEFYGLKIATKILNNTT